MQSRIPLTKPYRIDPSQVEIGDEISVEHPESKTGVTMTLRGIVGKRMDNGHTRHLMTEGGSTLVAWEPAHPRRLKVTLHSRAAQPQHTLFELPEDIEKRLA